TYVHIIRNVISLSIPIFMRTLDSQDLNEIAKNVLAAQEKRPGNLEVQ
ncbi:hypothetical protein LCGC14_2729320, partial [marine sediment metagenome]